MAQKTALALLLATAVMAASWAGASAQSGCTATLIGLVPCLSYIQGTTSTPSSSCCTQLASVVQSQPLCLCQILNGGGSAFGITVNQTQALALPSACNVKTPSPTLCNSVAGGPAASPAAAPPSAPPTPSTPPAAPSPPSSPSTPAPPATPSTPVPPSIPAPPSPATPSSPSTGEKSSAGRSDRMALSVTFALLFVAFYASNGLFF